MNTEQAWRTQWQFNHDQTVARLKNERSVASREDVKSYDERIREVESQTVPPLPEHYRR